MSWKAELRKNFTTWDALCDFLELDESLRSQVLKKNSFPLNLPYRLAAKIAKNRLDDPILRQFVPLEEENFHHPDFVADPLQESSFRKSSKLLKKYQGRALLVCTSACAMHCRFCFRREFPYDVVATSFEKELEMIANDPSLKEIILSGGDPLSLSNRALEALLDALGKIPHIKRVRLHTRFPIGIPERLEPALLDLLEIRPFQVWFVVHSNHVNELDKTVLAALKEVLKRGIPVLNQSVLLKGVNDSLEALQALCEKLVDHGIFPYYLHQHDRVMGAHHFDVAEDLGLSLIQKLQGQISGYGVPKYVREIPGKDSKTTL